MREAAPAGPGRDFWAIDYQYLFSEWKQMFSSGSSVVKDLWAGTTVALVALPLNLAFAVAAGVEPSVGITTGIVAGIIGALLGGQRFAVTGPAAAMAVVLVEVSQTYGIGGIWMVCLVAGLLQLLAGIFRLGRLISFIPMPVIVGFATAIGALVFFNAVDDFLGLPSARIAHLGVAVSAHKFLPQFLIDLSDIWTRCFVHQEVNFAAIGLGVLTLLIAYFLPRFTRAIPGQLVAVVVTTMVASFLHLNVPVIKDIAAISHLVPAPALPQMPWQDFFILFPTAITVFMLGSIDSLLSASVADGMTGSSKHHSNQELIGQGVANMIVPFFGGIPVTGVIVRTAVNIRAGARTRLAAIIHSLVLMALIFVFAEQTGQIPLSALAAILMLTGIRLIEWDAVREIWRVSRSEAYVVLATTIAAVAINLTAGVFIGLVFACGIFISQMSEVSLSPSSDGENDDLVDIPTCNYVRTYVVDGPLFFGAAERFIENIIVLDTVKVIILHMKAARVMDLTGVETLLSIRHQLRRHGGKLVLAELPAQPLALLDKTNALETIGKNNVFSDYKTAVLTVNNDLLNSSCKSCAIKEGKGPKDCRLRNALLDESSPMARMLEALKATPTRSEEAGLEWLFPVDSAGEIPLILRDTPIETLLLGQNLGEIQVRPANMAEIVIGMCIDFRKSLSIPRDWAFILRREGANMDGAEFAIALALSKGVRHMALIAHNSCAMSNTALHRDAFVAVLCEKYNWKRPQAVEFFDNHARSHDIGNEIDFVLQEAHRLSSLFPGLMVVPILFRVEDDRLYLIYDWLIANAKDDAIMRKLTLRDTGGFRTIKS
jgi:sulfate permease, SulP family